MYIYVLYTVVYNIKTIQVWVYGYITFHVCIFYPAENSLFD